MKEVFRKYWMFMIAIPILIGGISSSQVAVKWLNGTAGMESAIAANSAEISGLSDDQRRHQIKVNMKDIRTHLWEIEDRWAEKFAVEKNRIHDSLDELVHFMTPEARADFRELQDEYADLQAELKALNEVDDE